MTPTLNCLPTKASPITAYTIGSVEDVIAGRLNRSLTAQRFDATQAKVGFELASVQDEQALGEALLVNGTCFVTDTNENNASYMRTVSAASFISTGFFMLPKEANPTYTLQTNVNTPIELSEFYTQAYEQVQQPFAFSGFFTFEALQTTVIAKPPINNQNIFEHQAHYFSEPPALRHQATAFLVGIVADYNDNQHSVLLDKLRAALYQNPFDATTALTTHAHAIVFKTPVDDERAIDETKVDSTVHVLADKTTFSSVDVALYAIGAVEAWA